MAFPSGNPQLSVVNVDSTGAEKVNWPVQEVGGSLATGTTITKLAAAASTNATSVKASAGNLISFVATNTAAYAVFVKFYNKASAPTVGTDVPLYTFMIPTLSTVQFEPTISKRFSTGLAFAITKLVADSDATVLIANDLLLTYEWA